MSKDSGAKKQTLSELDGMTEQERMAKYNKQNFPSKNIRYGSGSGTISPYPKNDPRSKAYYDIDIKEPLR